MNEIYTSISVGLILGWLSVQLLGTVLSAKRALIGGIALGLAIMLSVRGSLPVLVLVSLFEPAALGLSFLILRSLAKSFISIKKVPVWEQVLAWGMLAAYYFTSAGMTMFDPYRFGFNPLWAGSTAAALCLYAGIRGYIGFALLPVAAQFVWISGLGSSNYFDHIFSALMIVIVPLCWVKAALDVTINQRKLTLRQAKRD